MPDPSPVDRRAAWPIRAGYLTNHLFQLVAFSYIIYLM